MMGEAEGARRWLKRLAVLGVVLVLVVVTLGAWTRLRDAGLGCPDWPTCYGSITVPLSEAAIQRAHALYPDQPFVAAKAWPEMIHRHFAKAVGLLCLILLVLAWRGCRHDKALPVGHILFLFLLVCLQGAFGAWTVTMKLFPPVVTGHLLLGFLTLTTLTVLVLRLWDAFPASGDRRAPAVLPLAVAATGILVVQIALGGWTASNYAATVCTGLPVCQPGWSQMLDFPGAFRLSGHAVESYEYAPHLEPGAKLAIHVLHRFGAMLTAAVLALLALLLWWRASSRRYRGFAVAIFLVLLVQLTLGVSNVVLQLPLPVAVAHNVVAALLLQLLVALVFSLYRETVTGIGERA